VEKARDVLQKGAALLRLREYAERTQTL